MWKIIWTTIFWALILVIAWFYLKFMDQDMGQQVSNWIMSVQPSIETTTGDVLSGTTSTDPMQNVLSWVALLQQQLADGLSGLNMKLDETKTLLQDSSKLKPTIPSLIPPKQLNKQLSGAAGSTWTK